MSRLGNRVVRLEGGKSEGVVVWAEVPVDWTEDRGKAAAAKAARERGVDRPDSIDLFPFLASGCEEMRLLFIGTHAEARDMARKILEDIGRNGSMKPKHDDGS